MTADPVNDSVGTSHDDFAFNLTVIAKIGFNHRETAKLEVPPWGASAKGEKFKILLAYNFTYSLVIAETLACHFCYINMKLTPVFTLCLFLIGQMALGAGSASDYFGSRPGSLAKAKSAYQAGKEPEVSAVNKIISEANKHLKGTPESVMDKAKTPPSGNKHDYMSIAPYFWPDPAKSNGLPYIRKDGKVNPESKNEENTDHIRLSRTIDRIETLSLAFYFTRDRKYADGAAKFIKVWFLNPDTQMNPNLNFAQAIAGRTDGRAEGVLDARRMGLVIDSANLISNTGDFTEANQKALMQWMASYYDWLMKSPIGKEERAAPNNHGTWFDVQAAHLALGLGKKDDAKKIIDAARTKRINTQIESDGKQPHELARTASFSYSCMNLDAFFKLANLGDHAGVDLWRKNNKDSRSLRKALDFLVPYIDQPPATWPYQQIKEIDESNMLPVLRLAALAYDAPEYESIIKKFDTAPKERFQILYKK